MTDPATSYDNRDTIRAVDHDRIALMLKLLWVILPLALGGVFGSGGAWFRLAEVEARQDALERKVDAAVTDGIRTDLLATRLDERTAATLVTIQRIERILEQMQRPAPLRDGDIP